KNISLYYFNYDCYIRLRNYFDNADKYEKDKQIFRKCIDTTGKQGTFEDPHYEIFEKLSHHLARYDIFFSVPSNVCCSNINYWLNNQI
ncbi:hypothetical protein PVMG_05316, partial [Plasmodium vivax Mauritania I]